MWTAGNHKRPLSFFITLASDNRNYVLWSFASEVAIVLKSKKTDLSSVFWHAILFRRSPAADFRGTASPVLPFASTRYRASGPAILPKPQRRLLRQSPAGVLPPVLS